jgi:hypothetical protein
MAAAVGEECVEVGTTVPKKPRPANREPFYPEILNRAGQEMEILAWSGAFSPGKYKSYHCKSSQVRVDPTIYSPEAKAKLERGIAWEIIQLQPFPERDPRTKSWEYVARHRFIMQLPESENAFHLILMAIREHFPRRAEIRTQVRFIDPITRATLRVVPKYIE